MYNTSYSELRQSKSGVGSDGEMVVKGACRSIRTGEKGGAFNESLPPSGSQGPKGVRGGYVCFAAAPFFPLSMLSLLFIYTPFPPPLTLALPPSAAQKRRRDRR